MNRQPPRSTLPDTLFPDPTLFRSAPPTPDGARPGRVYVHLLGTTDDPAPDATIDLMCHEGVPGHVMQGDIQVGQKSGPKFRQATRYVAFGEGWALYAEALCKEMGAYPDVARDRKSTRLNCSH